MSNGLKAQIMSEIDLAKKLQNPEYAQGYVDGLAAAEQFYSKKQEEYRTLRKLGSALKEQTT